MSGDIAARASVSTYWSCLSTVLGILQRLGPDLVSVLLYGSMARNEIRPGESDVLDVFVVLADTALSDQERFKAALLCMTEASVFLSTTGFPFHPFHYHSLSELRDGFSAAYDPLWHSDRTSQVVWGYDLRRFMKTTQTSRSFAGRLVWNLVLMMRRLSGCDDRTNRATPTGINDAVKSIQRIGALFPLYLCFAHDVWVSGHEALEVAAAFLPPNARPLFARLASADNNFVPGLQIDASLIREALILCEDAVAHLSALPHFRDPHYAPEHIDGTAAPDRTLSM